MPKYDYFVAHEFTRQEKDDLREAIDRAFRETGLNASYADVEFRSGEHILKKIEDRIRATQFGIYDITNQNPDVYLELGLAKGAGRTFYIICKKGTEIRADLQGLDRIEYESYKNLTDEIKKKILPEVSGVKKPQKENIPKKPSSAQRIIEPEPEPLPVNIKLKPVKQITNRHIPRILPDGTRIRFRFKERNYETYIDTVKYEYRTLNSLFTLKLKVPAIDIWIHLKDIYFNDEDGWHPLKILRG